MNILEARHKRARLYERQKEILAAAEKENRNLTAGETSEWDANETEFLALTGLIDRGVALEERERASIERHAKELAGTADPVTERTVFLSAEQRMTDWAIAKRLPGAEQELDAAKYLGGLFTKNWSDAPEEQRAMSEGVLGSGGYLVPTPLAGRIIDKARAITRVLQAGATIVPMTAEKLKVPRWTGDPTGAWVAENTQLTESDATVDQVELVAKAYAVGPVRASIQLVQDSATSLGDELVSLFAKVIAGALDKAALLGSGTGAEPKGLFTYTSGVNIVSMGANGAAITATNAYDSVIDAYQAIRDDNWEPNGSLILAPRTMTTYGKLKDTTNQPLRRPDELQTARFLPTTQVPVNQTQGTATNASSVFCGDWPQLLIGARPSLEIQSIQLKERYADFLQVGFIAFIRADVKLAHDEAFAVVKGIIP